MGLRHFSNITLVVLLAAQVSAAQAVPPPVPGFFDLPVTGGLDTYDAFGLVPEERGIALALLARQLHSQGAGTLERSMGKAKRVLDQMVGGEGA